MTRLEELREKYPITPLRLDPRPWLRPSSLMRYYSRRPNCVFSPRPGYNQNRDDY